MKAIDTFYHWLMINAPFWIMYRKVHLDKQHSIWWPRWRHSKKQKEEAEKWARGKVDNIKWE